MPDQRIGMQESFVDTKKHSPEICDRQEMHQDEPCPTTYFECFDPEGSSSLLRTLLLMPFVGGRVIDHIRQTVKSHSELNTS